MSAPALAKTKTTIFVSFTKYGLHCWPSCNIEKVNFLQHPHGHTFHFRLYFKVDELDRELEFFDVKDKIISFIEHEFSSDEIPSHMVDFGAMSCEHIATLLLNAFNASKVEVSEDGLDGAIVERS